MTQVRRSSAAPYNRSWHSILPGRKGRRSAKPCLAYILAVIFLGQSGCGGQSSFTVPAVVLSVSVADGVYTLTDDGSALLIAVVVVAPTETATFTIAGLPAGISATYKESESNPSGLLTLTGSPVTPLGTYIARITVGSSGQTASTQFPLAVQSALK